MEAVTLAAGVVKGSAMSDTATITFGTDGWRAVIGDDFTRANLLRVADAYARVLREDNPAGGTVLVGYDTRFRAGEFARAAAEVIAAQGFTVKVSDRFIPTPGLCWSVAHDDAAVGGVMLTASHNPGEYLGFKIRMADGGASPVSFTKRVEGALNSHVPAETASCHDVDLVGPYLAALGALVDRDVLAASGIRVVYDSMYGAGQGYVPQVLAGFGITVAEAHPDANPVFGGLHPEPIPPWIDEGRELRAKLGYDAAFFTDGDADRVGAADENGVFVNPHRILSLVTMHLVEDRGLTGRVVKTLSTSVLVDRIAKNLGLEIVTTPVGFKWIYEEMLKGDVLIGGEESGGIGIPTHVRERDGLLMTLLLIEMMAQRGRSLGELVSDLLERTGTMEYDRSDLRLDHNSMDSFRERMPVLEVGAVAGYEVRDTVREDGVKFLLADDAWLLLRPSGTEPLVRVYAEAPTADAVAALLAAGRDLAEGRA